MFSPKAMFGLIIFIKLAKFLDGGGVSLIYFQYFLDMSQNCWVFIEAIHLYCLVSIPYNMDWSEFAVSKYWYWANGFPFMCTFFWAVTHKLFNECRPADNSVLTDEDVVKMIIELEYDYFDSGSSFNDGDISLDATADHLIDDLIGNDSSCPETNFTDVFCSALSGLEALNMSHYDDGSPIFFFPGNLCCKYVNFC